MNKEGKLFVVSAPSGAGKTTLCEKLILSLPDVLRSISMTTRSIRTGEVQGKDYFFVTEKEFNKKLKNNEFLEFAKVFDNYYGTPKKFVEKNLKGGKDVLLNIDVQGAMKIRKSFRKKAVFIFILPPSARDLKLRLFKRKTDSAFQIKQRLEVAKKELSYLKYYDYQIINDDIKTAFNQLVSIFIAERCRLRN